MYGRVVDVRDVAAAHVRAAEAGCSARSSRRAVSLSPLVKAHPFLSTLHCCRHANTKRHTSLCLSASCALRVLALRLHVWRMVRNSGFDHHSCWLYVRLQLLL